MDEEYERPVPSTVVPGGDEESSGDEEDALDWTKLPGLIARPTIPKRGEKEYEPIPGGGSSLQEYSLDRSRNAMLEALKATRGTSSKYMTYAVWQPDIARVHVPHPRGIHFSNMGHSARRRNSNPTTKGQLTTRLELLPEEALYLIERGSLFCYKNEGGDAVDPELGESVLGTPMSVSQAFAEMIGKEDLTFERYQVYAYLKRMGFVATRAQAPSLSPLYPLPPPYSREETSPRSVLRPFYWISKLFSRICSWVWVADFRWRKPLRLTGWLHNCTYATTFKNLRFIPSGHSNPLRILSPFVHSSPYKIFYHLWKPSTSFKKTGPPLPDFELVVINARTTPLPTVSELTSLFHTLPLVKAPAPRNRQSPNVSLPVQSSFISRILRRDPPPVQHRPNPFAVLKAGRRQVIIAAVDNGTTTFMRFAEGCFEDWAMA